MDFERQANRMISAHAQLQQYLWGSWEIMMRGWIDTFCCSVEAWESTRRPENRTPLALRKLEILQSEPKPLPTSRK